MGLMQNMLVKQIVLFYMIVSFYKTPIKVSVFLSVINFYFYGRIHKNNQLIKMFLLDLTKC